MKNFSKYFKTILIDELLFYSIWTFMGWIIVAISILTIFGSFASSTSITNFGKINMSKSLKLKNKMRKNGYILLIIGVIFLVIGFRDKFSIEEDQNVRPAHYKKCTPFREGFGTCRTFDRKTVWVVRKESDGSEISRIEFPDSLNVISVGVFREGQAEVVGESRRRKYIVGYLTTSGDFISQE